MNHNHSFTFYSEDKNPEHNYWPAIQQSTSSSFGSNSGDADGSKENQCWLAHGSFSDEKKDEKVIYSCENNGSLLHLAYLIILYTRNQTPILSVTRVYCESLQQLQWEKMVS